MFDPALLRKQFGGHRSAAALAYIPHWLRNGLCALFAKDTMVLSPRGGGELVSSLMRGKDSFPQPDEDAGKVHGLPRSQ